MRIRPQLVFPRVRPSHTRSHVCVLICKCILVYMRAYVYVWIRALSLFFVVYIFFQQNSFNMLLQKMFAARVYVYVCKSSCVICVCVCVRVRCVSVCARARVSHEMMMDPYVTRLSLSTNERKGEKDREEKRAETSWKPKHVHIVYRILLRRHAV